MRHGFEHKADDRMRYRASEKLEIIRLVEQSHLPTKQTIDRLGPRTTFYRWYDKYLTGGAEALEDRSPKPLRVWKRIPDDVRQRVVDMALDEPELPLRELAVGSQTPSATLALVTRTSGVPARSISEASVYRLLKAHDLITSPAFVVIKAADEFPYVLGDKTTAINQMWQTDFTTIKACPRT
ncbi:helix-turn-helix Fis-type domain-containing protein [Ahrensia sp. R2A130]|nr:helix-turn-helix Fis-type domain-containing protein [Ahrensia sp. R2A130]